MFLPFKKVELLSMVVHSCNPSYLENGVRGMAIPGQSRQKLVRSYLKSKLKAKGPRGMTEVVEGLPRKHQAEFRPMAKKKKQKPNQGSNSLLRAIVFWMRGISKQMETW
jgi:hypothetical protein